MNHETPPFQHRNILDSVATWTTTTVSMDETSQFSAELSVASRDVRSQVTGETEPTSASHDSGKSQALSEVASASLRRDKIKQERESKLVVSSRTKQQKKISLQNATIGLTVNKLKFESVGLVGRNKEQKMLQKCLASKKREILFLGGFSGSGKTKLANSIMRQVEKVGGAFVAGKFDLHSRDEPYSGISAACREICGNILLQGEETVALLREEFRTTLGDKLQLLINIVPALEEVVGNQDVRREEGEQRLGVLNQQLNYAFRLFIRIVCTKFQPFVMVLDDLQWADVASLELMELLVTDIENPTLLVIGCYRSNEVDDSHIMSKVRRDLKDKSNRSEDFTLSEMEIGNLDIDSVNQVIMALLAIDDPEHTRGLADICYQRTQGNVFFLLAFITLLENEGFLTFNLGTFKWVWDESTIKEETASTDNVVELMTKKMNQVEADLAELLQLASFLGSKFDTKILRLVYDKLHHHCDGDEAFAALLKHAVEESFLEKAGLSSFRWVHDKVQEAALSTVSASKLRPLQYHIGTILFRSLEEKERDSLIFVIVNLLDSGTGLQETTNIEIAKLSARAAKLAKTLSAFDSASKYAAIGIKRLPSRNKWGETYYDLALDLYSTAAEADGIVANTDSMQECCDEVIEHGRNVLDKLRVYFAMADRMGNDKRIEEAKDLCLDVLKQLGFRTPKSGAVQAFIALSGLFKAKKELEKVNVETLPVMKDAGKLAAMMFLDNAAAHAYLIKDKVLLLYCTVTMVRLTIKHGLSNNAPSALATFGLVVGGVLKDIKAGSKYAEMAIAMTQKPEGKAAEARVTFRTWAFSLSYSRPWNDGIKPFLNGYKIGMQIGDTEGAGYCMLGHATLSFLQGKNLRVLEEDCRIYMKHLEDLGRAELAQSVSFIWDATQYLMGLSDTCRLFDDWNRETKAFELSRFVYRVAVYAYGGDYENGAKYALSSGDGYVKKAPGAITCQAECFSRGVCLYAMARKTKDRTYKKHGRAVRKTIKTWLQKGNMNAKHLCCYLDAEDAALCGDMNTAEKMFQEAIVGAARSGFMKDAGLANERYAELLLHDLGDKEQAKFRAQESIRFYKEYGAQRKVDLLVAKYRGLFPVPTRLLSAPMDVDVPSSLDLGGSQPVHPLDESYQDSGHF